MAKLKMYFARCREVIIGYVIEQDEFLRQGISGTAATLASLPPSEGNCLLRSSSEPALEQEGGGSTVKLYVRGANRDRDHRTFFVRCPSVTVARTVYDKAIALAKLAATIEVPPTPPDPPHDFIDTVVE